MATKKAVAPKSVGRSLNFAAGRLNALCAHLLDPHDLTLPQWVILSCLWRDGDLRVSELAELVGAGVPAMSRIVDRMTARGLVSRRKSDGDGRVAIVTLEAKGRALDHLADFRERINEALLDGFSETERESAYDLLDRMRANAENALLREG